MTDISEKTSKKDWKKYRTGNTVEYYDKDNQLACVTWLDEQGNTESEWYIEFFKSNNGSGYDYLKGPYYNPEKPQYAYQERYFYENGKLKELTFKDKDGHTRKNFKYYQNGKKKSVIDNDTQEYWQYNEKGVCTYYRRPIREDEKNSYNGIYKNDYWRETFYDDNGNKTATVRRNKKNEVTQKVTFYPNGNSKEVTRNIDKLHILWDENGNLRRIQNENFDIKFYDNGQVKEITSSGKMEGYTQQWDNKTLFESDKRYDYRKIRHQEFDRDGNVTSVEIRESTVLSQNQVENTNLSAQNTDLATSTTTSKPTRTMQERIAYLREERAKLNATVTPQEESRLCSYQEQKQQDNKENNSILSLWLRQCQNQI